eukprot:TRINITY_DN3471_c0_g1_i1.p1 TRINITY_DN3471_c0_g1~~TRINITY_DN3471_c0_g1_i1.p1  ORF type:complete len:658 (+),score=140.06 TRINITY_DN3471_c0_g1_i1:50-2023(+)
MGDKYSSSRSLLDSSSDSDDDENASFLHTTNKQKTHKSGEPNYDRDTELLTVQLDIEAQNETSLDGESISKGASLKRLFALAKPESWLIFFGTIALIVSSATGLVIPAYAGKIIDSVISGDPGTDQDNRKHLLNEAVLVLALVLVVSSIFTALRAFLFTIAGERVVARLRKNVFDSIIKQEIAFFDLNKTGELVNRISSDCEVIQSSVTINVSMGLRFSAQVIIGTLILFLISWKLTLVMLSVFPILIIGAVFYGRYVKSLSKQKQDALAKATDVADEAFTNIRTVRSFSSEQYEMSRYGERVDLSYRLAKKVAYAYGSFAGGGTFGGFVSLMLVMWYGATLVIEGSMSAGTLTSFILYTLTVAMAIGGLSSLYADLMKAVGASTRVFQLLDRKPKIRFSGGQILDPLQGEVELRDVRFSYPSRPNTNVMNNMNLTLSPGKIVALVGMSGGGKSTVTYLIEQFYHPVSGVVLLDDVDLKDVDPKFLHHSIGLVSQEPALFATTIKENILYGIDFELRNTISMKDIIKVAKEANAHDFIDSCEDKYETLVGERGIQLSGGQKQRIAIARALLKDPKILLLDEATSALDSESEHLVQEALDRLMVGRTVLVIAHRLSTVKNADVVAVVENGQIVEQGTHAELIEANGVYKQLVSRQLSS